MNESINDVTHFALRCCDDEWTLFLSNADQI